MSRHTELFFFSLLLNSAAASALEGFTVKNFAVKFPAFLRWNGKSLAWEIEKEKKQFDPLNRVVRLLLSPSRNLVCQITYGTVNKLALSSKNTMNIIGRTIEKESNFCSSQPGC